MARWFLVVAACLANVATAQDPELVTGGPVLDRIFERIEKSDAANSKTFAGLRDRLNEFESRESNWRSEAAKDRKVFGERLRDQFERQDGDRKSWLASLAEERTERAKLRAEVKQSRHELASIKASQRVWRFGIIAVICFTVLVVWLIPRRTS